MSINFEGKIYKIKGPSILDNTKEGICFACKKNPDHYIYLTQDEMDNIKRFFNVPYNKPVKFINKSNEVVFELKKNPFRDHNGAFRHLNFKGFSGKYFCFHCLSTENIKNSICSYNLQDENKKRNKKTKKKKI